MASDSDTQRTPLYKLFLSTGWQAFRQAPATFILLLFVVRFLVRRYISPLRQFPGPVLASGSRLWKVYITWSGHSEEDFITLHRRYGPVVRIGPKELSFASPQAAREILSPGKGFTKTDFYWVFPPAGQPDIFTEIREDVHAKKKRVANGPYSMASMQALTPYIEQTIQNLTEKIDTYADGKQAFDLGAYLHYFGFDVLGKVAFSTEFGFLEQGKDIDGVIQLIDDIQTYDGIVGQVPWLDYVLRRNPIWGWLRLVEPLSNNLITKMAISQATDRKTGKTKPGCRDLLELLLEGQAKNPDKLTDGDVFAIAHGAIFAGADSTASTMQTFMWNVLANQRVNECLTKEVLQVHKAGNLSSIVSWEEAQQRLPYFQACLKEAMRIGPGVGLNITRNIPSSGSEIDGKSYPGGIMVAVNAWVTHRDSAIFGQDADVFRPERWLPQDDKDELELERIKNMDRYMFQFGGGSHLCIGRNLALLEMNKVLPQILRAFEFELVHPGKRMTKHTSFFVVQEGLEVSVKKRKM